MQRARLAGSTVLYTVAVIAAVIAVALVTLRPGAAAPQPNLPGAGSLAHPRIAFTDDRDSLQQVDLTRPSDEDPVSETVTAGNREPVDPGGASSTPQHQGEASAGGELTMVSTADDPAGEVYVRSEGGWTRITCNHTVEQHPVISADGALLAYASPTPGGDWDIYVSENTEASRDTTPGDCEFWTAPTDVTAALGAGSDLWPTWTEDDFLVFSRALPGALADLYLLTQDGGTWVATGARQLTDTPSFAETQPTATEISNGSDAGCEAVSLLATSCDPTDECTYNIQTDTWVAFTTTQFLRAGSVALLDLDSEDPSVISPWAPAQLTPSSEPAWSSCPTQPYLAFTTTGDSFGQQDPYGDIAVGEVLTTNPAAPLLGTTHVVAAARGVSESHPAWSVPFPRNVPIEGPPPAENLEAELTFTSTSVPGAALDTPGRVTDADISDIGVDRSGRRVLVDESATVPASPSPSPTEEALFRYDEAGPDYSPDGSHIAFSRSVFPAEDNPWSRELAVSAADGSAVVSLAGATGRQPGDVDLDPVWSPDGTKLAFVRDRLDGAGYLDRVYVVDHPLGPSPTVHTVTPDAGPGVLLSDLDPTWSPDGKWLVFSRASEFVGIGRPVPLARQAPHALGSGDLYVVSSAGGTPARLTWPCDGPCSVPGRSADWSPDGTQLVYDDGGNLRIVGVDPAGPAPTELAADSWPVGATHAVTGYADRAARPFDRTGDPTPALAVLSGATDPAWSPNGKQIAFAGQPAGEPDHRSIWTIAPDGTGLTTVTSTPENEGPDTEPTWEPTRTPPTQTTTTPPPTTTTTTTTPPTPVADASVSVVFDQPVGYVGGHRTATVTVTNTGPDPAEHVQLATTYTNLTLTDFTEQGGSGCPDPGACDLGTLAPGATRVFTATVDTPAKGDAATDATVTTTTTDPDTDNNTAEATLQVLQPRVSVAPGVARPGQVVLIFGENMPPGTHITLRWDTGITIHAGPYRIDADGTTTQLFLLVRHDRLGERNIVARSTTGEFSPVKGRLLVAIPTLVGPDVRERG